MKRRLRVIAGWVVFFGTLLPCFVAIATIELAIRVVAVCEATVRCLWDNEPWLDSYRYEIENGRSLP